MYPDNLAYTKEHEWARRDGTVVTFGVTHYAQEQLGDVVFVELPRVGSLLTQFAPCGTIESVKAVSDLYAPVAGKVLVVNQELLDHPELVNGDPYGKGWMVQVEAGDDPLRGLMTVSEYRTMVGATG